ncbi:MAG TPA: DNA polymerase I, partial [Rikenellaceae bacterium]|nr:DNA polymerase I [Rikenellaceae bacterium]
MDKLFLIDGHALVFKMYYAFLRRPMINSKGADMSILFGFTKYLMELIEREKPTHIAVAFDPPGGTFRNEMYPAYKGTRPPTPQLVIDALEPLTELVKAMDIPVMMVPGFEADDVLGSAATQLASDSLDVYMVTPDKDYGQLIGKHVFQLKPGKGGSDNELVDTAALCEKWGIAEPSQVIDMLAICGDAADNVPGVKGVGEVGAAKLIAKYGTLENIYAHIAELTPKQQAMFTEAQPHMALSKALVTIKTDMQLPATLEDMRYTGKFSPRLAELFREYEFTSLKKYLPAEASTAEETKMKADAPKAIPVSPAEVLAAAKNSGKVGLVMTGSQLILASGEKVATVILSEAKDLLEDAAVAKYGVDLKKMARQLAAEGIGLQGQWNDIELMHYVINPERSHELAALAQTYLGVSLEEASAPATTGSLFDDVPEEDDSPRLKESAILIPLGEKLREQLPAFYDRMEEPLAKVLAQMELDGVKVDMAQLRVFADGLRKELAEREARIREMADDPQLNVSSPRQVGEVLFDKLQLDPKAKKTGSKTQYSTDEATLVAIADRHPIVDEILEFRAAKKLLSTYIEPFPSYISPADGRVHTTFNQALTATGRLSSSNPNLQNIPVRTERGKEIRKAFVPGTPEGVIVSADYSQIELRIMAHLSCDAHLIQAFRDGVDVHAATAAKIFGIPVSEVTREQRSMAKTANFGIMYGISSFGLAQRL